MKSLADFLWTLVRWALPVTVAAVVAAAALGWSRVGEEVRRRVEARLQVEFPRLAVTVRGAALVEGQGIVVHGLEVSDPALPAARRRLVWIDELRLACGTALGDLAAGEPRITAVTLRRPVLHAARAADGRWSVAALARAGAGGLPVPVAVEDATLVVEDARTASRFTLRSIGIDLRPAAEGGGTLVRGSVMGELFERADFEGRLAAGGGFELAGRVAALDLSPRLRALVPAAAGLGTWLEGLQGRVHLDWRGAGALAALDRATFTVAGRLEAGRFEHAALPFALSDASARFVADRAGISCEALEAHSGATTIRGGGRITGWAADADIDLLLEAERLIVGRHWEGLLPAPLAAQWSRLMPAGEIDLRAHLVRQAGRFAPEVSLRCRNVSLTHYRFPYRVDRTVGTVTLKEGSLALHLTGQAGGHPVHVEGTLAVGTPGVPGAVEVRGEGMRIDDALLAALPARSADVVRTLRAGGTFDFAFRHERDGTGHANSLGIRLAQGSLSYAGFPYPLSNVSGSIRMDRGRWTIKELTGTNDTGVVRCTGSLERHGDDDGELRLELTGSDVVLERELRDALPPGMRRIWDDVDPRGNAEFSARVRHRLKARRTEVELEAMPRGDTVSIEPAWFPYRLEKLRGKLEWKDGRLRFSGVRGVHARTTLTTEGSCRFTPDGGWHVSFEQLAADRFRADHDVLTALPAGLRQALSAVRLGGLLSVDGALEIGTTTPAVPGGAGAGPVAAAWDMELDLERATVDVGEPLEHVHGGIRLRGQSDGHVWRTTGDVAIDSALWRGVQVTAVRGPLAMDATGVRFGAPAASGTPGQAGRLAARIAGGTLLLDGSVAAGEPGTFTVAAALADADLERLAGDVTGAPLRYRGRVHGAVEVRGSRGGAHSLVGRGQLRLRDADVYELPVVVALLKILRVRAPDRSAFTSSLVDFRIEGPRAYLDTIELSGDAISLVGAGEVDFDSNVRLTFRPLMGESAGQLPVMKRVLGGAGGQFMLVHVDGTLAEPRTTTEAFPTLAAAVQRLQAQGRTPGGPLASAPEAPRRR